LAQRTRDALTGCRTGLSDRGPGPRRLV